MGVDFSHGDVHFSYANFNRFRRRLAKEICVTLDDMEGFGGGTSWDKVLDPLAPLLCASDCGGEIPSHDCQFVADRIRDIVATSPDDPMLYWKDMALRVAEAMQIAADKGEAFRLC